MKTAIISFSKNVSLVVIFTAEYSLNISYKIDSSNYVFTDLHTFKCIVIVFYLKIDRELGKRPTERETFAAWLASVVAQVPSDKFRSFQTEAFSLCLRYLGQVDPEEPSIRDPLPASSTAPMRPFSAPTPLMNVPVSASATQQYTLQQPFVPLQYRQYATSESQTSQTLRQPVQQACLYSNQPIQQERRPSSALSASNIVAEAFHAVNSEDQGNITDLTLFGSIGSTSTSQTREIQLCQETEKPSSPTTTASVITLNIV